MKTTTLFFEENTKSISISNCTIDRKIGVDNQPSYSIICSAQERFEVNNLRIDSSGGIYFNPTVKLADYIIINEIELSNSKYGIICNSQIEEEKILKSFNLEYFYFKHLQQAFNIRIKENEYIIYYGRIENCNNEFYKNPKGEEKHGIIEITFGESSTENNNNNNIRFCIERTEFFNNEYLISRNNKNEKPGGGIGLVIETTSTVPLLFKIEITRCIFISNNAKTNNEEVLIQSSGGAFYFPSNFVLNEDEEEIETIIGLESLTITDCLFINNTASNKGGAIYIGYNSNLKSIYIKDTMECPGYRYREIESCLK